MFLSASGRPLAAVLVAVILSGCASVSVSGSWGGEAHWPDRGTLRSAAMDAARDPHTWVPLASAALLIATGADDSASEWLERESPLFGRHAGDRSDLFADLSAAAYFITALAARSDRLRHKARGLGVGVGAMAFNKGVTGGMKSLVGRERPNGRDRRSFPSGHSSGASVSATLAVANLDYLPVANGLRTGLTIGFYGLAAGTAVARVEAGEHHLGDVLTGYALGHFIGAFAQRAFLEPHSERVSVGFSPSGRGGSFVIRVGLGEPQ